MMLCPGRMYDEFTAVGLRSTSVIVAVRPEAMQAHAITIDNPVEVFNVCLYRLWELSRMPNSSPNRVRILGWAPMDVICQAISHHEHRIKTFREDEGAVIVSYMGESIGKKEYVYVGKNRGYNNHEGMWLDVRCGRIGYKPMRGTIVEVNVDRRLGDLAWRVVNIVRQGLLQARDNCAKFEGPRPSGTKDATT